MSKIRNLAQRGTMYYARVALPKQLIELREAAGLPAIRERWKTLNTGSHADAVRCLPVQVALLQREFDEEIETLGSVGAQPLTPATDDHLRMLRERFFNTVVRDQNIARNARPSRREREQLAEAIQRRLGSTASPFQLLADPDYLTLAVAADAPAIDAEKRDLLAEEIRTHLGDQEFVLVSDYIRDASRELGVRLEEGTNQYRSLARGLLTTWLRALDVGKRQDLGEEVAEAVPAASAVAGQVTDLAAVRLSKRSTVEPLDKLFDRYLRECKAHIKPSDRQGLIATVRQFTDVAGRKDVRDYSIEDMAKFKRALPSYPRDAGKRYAGLTFNQAVAAGARDKHPCLASNTIRSKLSALSAFGKWLESNVTGVYAKSFSTTIPQRDKAERMEPFTADEVVKILNAHAFTGCASRKNYTKPGTYKVRGWQFWLPLIAAFTGARLNEITQLRTIDLREDRGIWVFDFTAQGEGQRLKTASSARIVPVHPQLVDLGLVRFKEEVELRGGSELFDLIPKKDGSRSPAASRWFVKFLKSIGIKEDSGPGGGDRGGMHRWRHTATDALRRADVTQYDIAAALGHTIDIARMTSGYGREMDMSLARRTDIVSKIDYADVDWGRLL